MYIRKRVKNLDFLKAEKQKSTHEAVKKWIRSILILMPLVLFICFLQIYLYCMEMADLAESEILVITGYITDKDILEQKAGLRKLYKNMKLLEQYEEEADRTEEYLKNAAILPGNYLEWIQYAMGDHVQLVCGEHQPIRYEDGVLEFSAATDIPAEAYSYIERLVAEGNFHSVIYSGFEKIPEQIEGELAYMFDVKCRLKTPAQEEG